MKKTSSFLCVFTIALTFHAVSTADEPNAPNQTPPTIINYGWSLPNTRYLKLYASEMEQRPFTGTAAYVGWPVVEAGGIRSEGNDPNNLSWQVFKAKRFTPEMIQSAIEDVKATQFKSFKNNFMQIVAYTSDKKAPWHPFDWFDDERWATVCHNAQSLAKVARAGGYKGIIFDPEEYAGTLFWTWNDVHSPGGFYDHMVTREGYGLNEYPAYKNKTFGQVRTKVRQRGRQFIQAINKELPGCTFWGLWTYSRFVGGMRWDRGDMDPLHNNGHLYNDFLDGMLEASDDETIFVDGCEDSYRYSKFQQFAHLRTLVKETAPLYSGVPKELYRKKVRVGFGLFLDMENLNDWSSDTPEDNRMPPKRLERVVEYALEISDGYVWVYTQYPSWWLYDRDDKFPEDVTSRDDHRWIHPAYQQAIERAIANYNRSNRTSPKKDTPMP